MTNIFKTPKNKYAPRLILFMVGIAAATAISLAPGPASALTCPDGTVVNPGSSVNAIENACKNFQSNSPTAGVVNKKNDCRPNEGEQLNKTNCGIINMIVIITNILSGIVGVIIVIMITVGGIQYTVAGADPQKVTAAKLRIRSALLALFVYIFMFAFLQWIVPGGLF